MDWQKHEKPIIVGAGIAGLSSALALSDKGISNLVLESRDHLEEVGAGIQLAPNATRLLKKWGVLDRLMEVGVKTHFLELRDGLSAKTRMQVNLAGCVGTPLACTIHHNSPCRSSKCAL